MDLVAKLHLYETPSATSEPAPGPAFLQGFEEIAEDLYSRQVVLPVKRVATSFPHEALSLPVSVTGLLDLAGSGLPTGSILFLDTETTGLSTGTGTIPFLIGLAWLAPEPDRWIMRQLFLNSPGAQNSLVAELDEIFKQFPYLCTFNGKSYDVPLIRSRFILQRRSMKTFAHHFDLLHIWKRLLPGDLAGGFRQKNLESCVLGILREGDLDGAAIPGLYFDWAKYGVDNGLSEVIRHNELDMCGMIGLYGAAAHTMDSAGAQDVQRRIRVGRLLHRNHLHAEAIRLLRPIAEQTCGFRTDTGAHLRELLFEGEQSTAPTSSSDGTCTSLDATDLRLLLTSLGLAAFRLRDYAAAARWFSHLVERLQRADHLLFLLRLLEHRLQDYPAALACLTRYGHLLDPAACARRSARLERKRS